MASTARVLPRRRFSCSLCRRSLGAIRERHSRRVQSRMRTHRPRNGSRPPGQWKCRRRSRSEPTGGGFGVSPAPARCAAAARLASSTTKAMSSLDDTCTSIQSELPFRNSTRRSSRRSGRSSRMTDLVSRRSTTSAASKCAISLPLHHNAFPGPNIDGFSTTPSTLWSRAARRFCRVPFEARSAGVVSEEPDRRILIEGRPVGEAQGYGSPRPGRNRSRHRDALQPHIEWIRRGSGAGRDRRYEQLTCGGARPTPFRRAAGSTRSRATIPNRCGG